MPYFKMNVKRKKPSVWKWLVYAVVLIALLFIFIPRYLIYRANNIIEAEIPDTSMVVTSPPSKQMMVAYNYYQVAKFFPVGEKNSIAGQKFILDYYFPLFKKDWESLKFACVDNAILRLSAIDTVCKDSVNIMALQKEWMRYPDSSALCEFWNNWDSYHKKYQKELKDYYRFRDAKHL